MKKIILLSFIFAVAMMFNSGDLSAQSFNKGDINVGAGIGLGSRFGGGLPIAIHGEYGITDAISGGVYAAFVSHSYWTYTVIGVRGAYHFNELLDLSDELDVYGGLTILNTSVKADGIGRLGGVGSGLDFGIYIGGRYYFTDNIAAYAELGNGVAYFQVGVTLKL